MVTVNNKNGSHIKDYSSAKIQKSKDKSYNNDKPSKYPSSSKYNDKLSKYPSSSKYNSNKRHNDNKSSSPIKTRNNNSLVDDLQSEIKSLKTQLEEQRSESRTEISDLKKKVFRLHNEKSKLSKDVEINEVKEVDHKLKNVEKLKQDLSKAQHKNVVIKDILDETREEINSLKKDKEDLICVIEDFGDLGFIDSIKGKKPDSYYKFFKKS